MIGSQTEILLLNRLEELEVKLLALGFVDGGFTYEELCAEAERILNETEDPETPEVLVQHLLRDKLLTEAQLPVGMYRTRFAEGVRLFARLRQIFRTQDWRSGTNLVGDFRVRVMPREYAVRSLASTDFLERLAQSKRGLTELEHKSMLALIGAGRRLAEFQARATEHIREELVSEYTGASIVCAPTGAGKSLAFYLPCLVEIGNRIRADQYWTQALALYPRKVLLADQFASAFKSARALDKMLPRPIRIGAYYDSIPNRATIDEVGKKNWSRKHGGYVFPTMRCQMCEEIDGDLVWRSSDLSKGIERLVCSHCGAVVTAEQVALTRESLRRKPPELLFSTTEMLNKEMSSAYSRGLFGLDHGREHSPYLLLLDEAHTYSGVPGAQVGLVVRRWRNAVRHPVHIVGLSATLEDARGYFAQLVGLSQNQVHLHEVEPGEKEYGGRQYHLVLRGDPTSGASLLSVSIQASMLLARLLDPPGADDKSLFPPKLFAFTDDLDVVNRLYDNLLDAEGYKFYKPRDPSLATLRANGTEVNERYREGQYWKVCEEIGNALGPGDRLGIGRISSQDPGLDPDKKIVVATASLEVGYDDPAVGAVLQHKAPKEASAFLQRKGRAGRQYEARPWTVVVLSDFGRDRQAYESWELTLEPELRRPPLPITNRYVLKMQAVASTVDWLQTRTKDGSTWMEMAEPARPGEFEAKNRRSQERLVTILEEVLEKDARRRELEQHLQRSLKIDEGEVSALLWEPPRALMTTVLPTAIRQLKSNWSVWRSNGDRKDHFVRNSPLPDFLSSNLFSDLNMPEAIIRTNDGGQEDTIPIALAMKEACPGRVTRRFATNRPMQADWMPLPDLEDGEQTMTVERLCEGGFEFIDLVEVKDGHKSVQVACYRMLETKLEVVPRNVKHSSNAFPDWRSELVPEGDGSTLDAPTTGTFARMVIGIEFFTHNNGSPVRCRRFSIGSQASLFVERAEEKQVYVRYIDGEGVRAGVGFEQFVDGMRFRVGDLNEQIRSLQSSSAIRALRSAYFRESVQADSYLRSLHSGYTLAALADVFLGMVLKRAMRSGDGISGALDWLSEREDWGELAEHAMGPMLKVASSSRVEEQEDATPDEESDGVAVGSRLVRKLRPLMDDIEVRDALLRLAVSLHENPGPSWKPWLKRRLKSAIAGSLLQACIACVPDAPVDSLVADIDNEAGDDEIWLTESVLGGTGLVEQIAMTVADDPTRLFLLAELACQPNDIEECDDSLLHLLNLVTTGHELSGVFTLVRDATSHAEASHAQSELKKVLAESGVTPLHSLMVWLNSRVLRSGSDAEWDFYVGELMKCWRDEEGRLGIEIDLRLFCYLATFKEDSYEWLEQKLKTVGGDGTANSRFRVLQGTLWPRGEVVRRGSIEYFNRFAKSAVADPLLIRVLIPSADIVDVEEPKWFEKACALLRDKGSVVLRSARSSNQALQAALLTTLTNPVEVGFLRLYPRIVSVQRDLEQVTATLNLLEVLP